MKPETIQAADGMQLSMRVYDPDRAEHEAKLWPRMAEWLGVLARPAAS
jgi:hypothetical protein